MSRSVINACTEALSVPPQEMFRFPRPEICVGDLLKKITPIQSSAFVATKPESWFSKDLPSSNLNFLTERQIPTNDFLQKLEKHTCQAWLDSAQSLVDSRYNEGTDWGPLWTLAYWKEMVKVADAKASWARCERWLSVNTEKQSETASDVFANASAMLPGLGWRTLVHRSDNQQTTLEFSKLIGNEWLSSGLLQMMIDNLTSRVKSHLSLMSSTIIAGPSFAQTIESAAIRELQYGKRTTPLLSRYEEHIKNNNTDHLYFPANINENHWIAVHINFKKREFSYGKQMQLSCGE